MKGLDTLESDQQDNDRARPCHPSQALTAREFARHAALLIRVLSSLRSVLDLDLEDPTAAVIDEGEVPSRSWLVTRVAK